MDLIRLGDIATYINGYAFKPKDWREKGIPIIRIQNLNDPNKEYNYFDGEIDSKYLVNEGDILISWSASIGVYEWRGQQGVLNQHIFKVDFNKIKIDKKYFKYIVSIALNRALQYMHGSTMKHITKQYFDNILIPVPLFDQQIKIANILDQAQELIDKRKAQIEALDELIQSVFYDMFGDPISNIKKWRTEKIEDISSLVTKGESPSWQGFSYQEEGNLFVTSENVLLGRLDKTKRKYICNEFYKKLKRSQLEENDILVNLVGASIGRGALVTKDILPANINQAVALIRLNSEVVHPNFLLIQIITQSIQEQLIGNKVEGARANISLKNVRELELMVPPLDIQMQFVEIVNHIEKQKALLNESLVELENNFNSLMQRAFNGELLC